MMKDTPKISSISGKEIATMSAYGYKDYKILKKILKFLGWCIVISVAMMLYLSIFVIFIYSINSNKSVNEFGEVTLKWYKEIWNHRMLRTSIINTFAVSLVATLLSTIFGTLIAIGIYSAAKKKQKWMMLLNNIPLLNADIVTGISLMLIFSLLLRIFPYLFGFPTLIIAHVYFTLPYVILNVLPKLREMDPNLIDAALDLGVKPRKAIWKVVVPAVKSGILSGVLMAFTMSFDDFVISYFTTGNGFDNLSIWIYGSIGRKDLTPAVYAFNSLVIFGAMAILLSINAIRRKNQKRSKQS
ncbi:MAG: ABC transporter permease [Prevotella sp.]|nr:ABC transporter permease [Staphylococcus sp.]MCM1350081.1 ABC transporter permease [Prevotella sp.]